VEEKEPLPGRASNRNSLNNEMMNAPAQPALRPFLMDPYWRRARIAARILLRRERGPLSERDRRLAAWLALDPGMTNRLLDQAVHFTKARQNGYRLLDRRD
jgi:hypothetical protein